ncbi:MAG: peptidoglycan-binding domain-containing protein [Actinomycetota bacterium]|nr:peptidoglycan-binding domain-containing protein [Actinomycetota bacterium]
MQHDAPRTRRTASLSIATFLALIAGACSSDGASATDPVAAATTTAAVVTTDPASTTTSTATTTTTSTTSTVPAWSTCPGGDPAVLRLYDGVSATCDAVWSLQTLLRDWGFGIDIDGELGPRTQQAVKDFQRLAGLAETGEVDASLWALVAVLPPMAEVFLHGAGIGTAALNDDPDTVLRYLVDGGLGEPDSDTGWVVFTPTAGADCTPRYRYVSWSFGLRLEFGEDAAGAKRFLGYTYTLKHVVGPTADGPLPAMRMATDEGMVLGDSLAAATALYPTLTAAETDLIGLGFRILYHAPVGDGSGHELHGFVGGTSTLWIDSIGAGLQACYEV